MKHSWRTVLCIHCHKLPVIDLCFTFPFIRHFRRKSLRSFASNWRVLHLLHFIWLTKPKQPNVKLWSRSGKKTEHQLWIDRILMNLYRNWNSIDHFGYFLVLYKKKSNHPCSPHILGSINILIGAAQTINQSPNWMLMLRLNNSIDSIFKSRNAAHKSAGSFGCGCFHFHIAMNMLRCSLDASWQP